MASPLPINMQLACLVLDTANVVSHCPSHSMSPLHAPCPPWFCVRCDFRHHFLCTAPNPVLPRVPTLWPLLPQSPFSSIYFTFVHLDLGSVSPTRLESVGPGFTRHHFTLQPMIQTPPGESPWRSNFILFSANIGFPLKSDRTTRPCCASNFTKVMKAAIIAILSFR